NGGFPGPLLRFQEGREVTVEVHNDTEAPEQLHWHGQKVSTDVDGAAEEGTPYIHTMRRNVRGALFDRRGRRGGRGHPLHSGAWCAAHHLHATARRTALLSHAQPCRGGPARRAIQRAGRSSVH